MPEHCRNLFHALFADAHFQHEEQSVVNAPDDIVPAGTVPQTGAEPDQQQPADFPAFAEQRYVQQVVAEERSQRNVPTLPELSDVLAEERVAEVFVQMKAEDAGNANCHIGIAGEIEVHLQGVENYTVPDTQCGLGGEVVPQELVYDAGEPVCQYDLFAQTNGNASEANAKVVGRHPPLVQICLHGFVPCDRSGNGDREKGNVQQEREEISFRLDFAPRTVDEIGNRAEREKADAQRQRQVGDGNGKGEPVVQVLNEKAGVLKSHQCTQIQHQSQSQECLCGSLVAEFVDATPQHEVDQCTGDDQPQKGNIPAGVEQQGKDDQHCVAVRGFLCRKIAEKTNGEE